MNHEQMNSKISGMRRWGALALPLRRGWSSTASLKPSAVPMKTLSESWAQPSSANYLEAQYEAWRKDPATVHVSWRSYFDSLDKSGPGLAHVLAFFFFLGKKPVDAAWSTPFSMCTLPKQLRHAPLQREATEPLAQEKSFPFVLPVVCVSRHSLLKETHLGNGQ